jgi:hypothetical protein
MNHINSFFDSIDLIAARMRHYLRAVALMGGALQAAIATGTFKPDGHWTNWVALGNIVLAYFTIRSGEAPALAQVKREESGEHKAP